MTLPRRCAVFCLYARFCAESLESIAYSVPENKRTVRNPASEKNELLLVFRCCLAAVQLLSHYCSAVSAQFDQIKARIRDRHVPLLAHRKQVLGISGIAAAENLRAAHVVYFKS